MSNKSNLSTILGVAAATVLAGGGSAFVTDAGLRMIEKNTAIVQETDVAINQRETELPITVETFTSTKDSFTVKAVSETEKKKESEKETTAQSESNTTQTDSTPETEESSVSTEKAEGGNSETETSAISIEGASESSSQTASRSQTESSKSETEAKKSEESKPASADLPAVSYDEWGGWTASNGDYFDGQGGYYDGSGYHYVGDSIKTPQGAADYQPSSSGSDSGSYSGGWDDSYILYDTAVRYLSERELADWGSWELAAARNEIFARHGRIFYTAEWSSYFAQKSWYTPRYENVDDMLSDVEWANLKLIMKLEEKFY